MATRPPQRRVTPPPRRKPTPVQLGFAAVAILLGAFIVLRPSPYSKVANLSSSGTTVIAFGDSLTAGYGASAGDDYPTKLAASLNVPVVNAGVSGDTTDSALARIEPDVIEKNPRVVIIGLGGNDFLRGLSIATTEANLRTIIRRVQSAGAMAVLLGFRFPRMSANYETMYERVAEEEKALFVPNMLKGILNDPSKKSDDIHPNAAGYALMAERVQEPLRELLAKADDAR